MAVSDAAQAFVDSLESYFGPWRGEGTKHEIATWVSSKGIERQTLRKVYRRMRDTRRVEPVNTISIVDVWDEVDRLRDVSRPPLLDAPEDVKEEERDEVAQFLRRLSEDLCDNTRRQELLRQREGN